MPLCTPVLQGRCKAEGFKIKHHIAESQAACRKLESSAHGGCLGEARISEYEKQTTRLDKRAGPSMIKWLWPSPAP